VTDNVSNASSGDGAKKTGKKRKPHRGYAFVVFEREKDMKGMYLAGFVITFEPH
jgi:hypothetical protein